MPVRILEVVDSTPVEIVGPETEVVPDSTYDLKLAFELVPYPFISGISAILIQLMNEGESRLRSYLDQYNCYAEIIEKENWWEWEIPYISVKKVWFRYKFTAKPKVAGLGLPAIPLVLVAKYVIAGIIILAGILIAWSLVKVTVYMEKLAPFVAPAFWIIILGIVGLGGIWIVKEIIGAIGE